LTNKTNRELNGVCLNIRSKINYNFDDKFWNGIYLLIKKKYKRHLIEKKIYSCFLKKIQSKVVFCHCGSYGGYQALSIICNRLNIIYVEFQHGLVSRNHQAYNYGEVFVRSDIAKNLLPRYFLTFGKYWSEQIRIPGKTVEVGFPFLLEKALLVKSKKQYHLGITVLVVSDATLPDFYVDLVKKLSNEKYEYPLKIIFKLHPVEAPMLRKWYGSLMEIENVIIKTHESIYNIITDADIIVGCSSTVMFEALQFSLKPFVYVNDYSNAHIDYFCFHTFNDVEDLLRQIREEKYIHEEQDIAKNVDYIWEQHPRECFRKFINGILDGKAHG
jgi:hypothetical protein